MARGPFSLHINLSWHSVRGHGCLGKNHLSERPYRACHHSCMFCLRTQPFDCLEPVSEVVQRDLMVQTALKSRFSRSRIRPAPPRGGGAKASAVRIKKANAAPGTDRDRPLGSRFGAGSRGAPQLDDGHHAAAMANDKRDALAGGRCTVTRSTFLAGRPATR